MDCGLRGGGIRQTAIRVVADSGPNRDTTEEHGTKPNMKKSSKENLGIRQKRIEGSLADKLHETSRKRKKKRKTKRGMQDIAGGEGKKVQSINDG